MPTADLDRDLDRHADAGAAAWPQLSVDRGRFVAHLRERAGDDVARLRAGNLYLACACLAGEKRALALLEERFLARLPAMLARADLPAAAVDEALAVLRERLLVPSPGGRARLADYAGTGELGGWLRVIAVRETLSILRKGKREVPLDEPLLAALPAATDDPELELLKERYRREFDSAFTEGLAALTPRERNLLRHQLVHELNVDQIGALYSVHRATAARWVEAARSRLQQATRDGMMARLKLDRGAVDSIMRLIRSQIDVSVCGHLSVEDEPK